MLLPHFLVIIGALLASCSALDEYTWVPATSERSIAQVFGTGNMALHGTPDQNPDGNFHAELNNTLLVSSMPHCAELLSILKSSGEGALTVQADHWLAWDWAVRMCRMHAR